MEKINIIDKLSIKAFQEEYADKKNYEVKAAVFLTYSIKPKVILALLHELFFDESGDTEKKAGRDETKDLIDRIVRDLINREVEKKQKTLKDKFAVYYNNGSRAAENKYTIADALAMQFAYPVDMGIARSFHPKVYIVVYGPKDGTGDIIYRFLIGSHNLSESNAIEYGYCFDRTVDTNNSSTNTNDSWEWLKNLLQDTGNSFSIMNQNGKKLNFDKLPVIDKIIGNRFSKELPMILTDFGGLNKLLQSPNSKSKIFSPFISAERCKNKNVELYTNAFELEKRGFVLCDKNDTNAIPFWIFSPEEGTVASNYTMPHFKVYHIGKEAYVGSLNNTKSAFEKNKEVLVQIPEKSIDIFEKTVLGGNSQNSWYKMKYYKEEPNKINPKNLDVIFERFKKWIQKNLTDGSLKLSVIKSEDSVILNMDINCDFNKINEAEVWNNIGDNAYPKDFDIKVCPENYSEKDRKSLFKLKRPKLEWNFKSEEADLLRSSNVYFYLYANGKEYPYCRVYPLLEGEEILNSKINIAVVADYLRMSVGETGSSETTSGENTHNITIAKFRQGFSLYDLDTILKSEPNNRKNMIKRMKSKLEILESLYKEKDNQKELQEKILQKIGCVPADILVLKKLIEQSKEMLDNINKIFEDSSES